MASRDAGRDTGQWEIFVSLQEKSGSMDAVRTDCAGSHHVFTHVMSFLKGYSTVIWAGIPSAAEGSYLSRYAFTRASASGTRTTRAVVAETIRRIPVFF
jgi:hypothetical protein